jgi:hypothetical protein
MMRVCTIAALILVACRGQPTAPVAALEVTTTVTPATVHIGHDVSIMVVVKNRTSRTLSIETHVCVPFEVTTMDGSVVGPRGRTCTLISIPKSLAPGEQYLFTTTWSGDARDETYDPPPTNLSPGTYLVRGLAYGASEDNPSVTVQVIP